MPFVASFWKFLSPQTFWRIAWFTHKGNILLFGLEHNHRSWSDTINLLSTADPLSILWPLSFHHRAIGACQTSGQNDKSPDDNAREMFTYAILKGSLIKHSSHSDNHQSHTVTMLICEVMIWIVFVNPVNNTLIFLRIQTCATKIVINDKCQRKHHLLLNIPVNSIKCCVLSRKKYQLFTFSLFWLNSWPLPDNNFKCNDLF